ncbi:MAG: hypothetical protein K6F53_08780 [Lachnospiraceae bacterium]|nr:hypothetical protein [Lachnospiraceae bacterium]
MKNISGIEKGILRAASILACLTLVCACSGNGSETDIMGRITNEVLDSGEANKEEKQEPEDIGAQDTSKGSEEASKDREEAVKPPSSEKKQEKETKDGSSDKKEKEQATDTAKAEPAGKTSGKIIKEEVTPEELQRMVKKALPGVVCWGDSITYGYLSGGPNYPDTLRKRIDTELIAPIREASGIDSIEAPVVLNFGVSAETTAEIAGRAGGYPYLLGADVVIPKEVLSVPVKLEARNGDEIRPLREVTPLRNGVSYEYGSEYYSLDGIKGKLERYFDPAADRSFYRFTRLEAGEEKRVYKGTPLISEVSDGRYLGYICVVLMGANGGYEPDFGEDLAAQFRSIVAPYSRYFCIGMCKEKSYTYSGDLDPSYEPALKNAFGDRFVSIQELLNGNNNPDTTIPAYLLLPDQLHYTEEGYEEIGNRVYERLDALGYFDELKELAQRF